MLFDFSHRLSIIKKLRIIFYLICIKKVDRHNYIKYRRFFVIFEEIKIILEKNGYDLDSDSMGRIKIMLESIRDDNQINKLDYIIDWFNKKREESDMVVEEIGIHDLDKWKIDLNSGNVKHESGGFFELIGVKIIFLFNLYIY